jgi:hypothetical protein
MVNGRTTKGRAGSASCEALVFRRTFNAAKAITMLTRMPAKKITTAFAL